MKRWNSSIGFALLVNLLLPGLGYVYIGELLFGLFVFLIILLGSIVFFLSLLVSLPATVQIVLLGLPLVFYLLTLIDLVRTVNKKPDRARRSGTTAVVYLLIGALFQLAAPITPVNYLLRNRPRVFRVATTDLSPWLTRGDYALSSTLRYRANLFFLDRPVRLQDPQPGQVVRFFDTADHLRLGIVLGLPGDRAQIVDGILVVNGESRRDFPARTLFAGTDLPLTTVQPASILVVALRMGAIDSAFQVPFTSIEGRVLRLS